MSAPPTPAPPAADEPDGSLAATQIGRYELLIKLAVGGMGSVYVGRQRGAAGFERLVAIKRMHSHVAQTPEMLGAFLDEARIAALIHHPNVVRVQDVYESEGECLLVMDYVDGVALSGLLWAMRQRGEMPPPRASLRVMIDALLGLHAAHELRGLDGAPMDVVHRDVSPQNVLLGAGDGVARVTDFGIARAAGRSTKTRTGQVKGKLRYMPPEQATEGVVDRRADLFAASVVLWELLAGRRFFKGENDAKILLEIASGEYPDLAAARPDLPPALAALVTRGLARDPARRWPTALEFAQALEDWGRSQDWVAHHTEVAALVTEACGDQLAAQRESISAALRRPARGLLAEPSAPPPRPASRPPSTPSPSPHASSPSQPPTTGRHLSVASTHLGQPDTRPSRRPRWSPLSVFGVVVFGAALGVTLMLAQPRFAPNPSATAPAPSAAPAPTAASVRVLVVSDAGVRAVEAPGASDLRVTPEGASLSLPKSDEPVRLAITLASGEQISEMVFPDSNAVVRVRALREPERAAAPPPSAPHPARPAGRPGGAAARPPATGTSAPGLKKNPYEN
jgi:serine/threonine protein kinase